MLLSMPGQFGNFPNHFLKTLIQALYFDTDVEETADNERNGYGERERHTSNTTD